MKNEKINEIREQLELENEKWYTLYDMDSIQLKNGIGVYPNWKFMRFLFTENEILIKHGTSVPYGGRIISKFMISSSQMSVSFPYGPLLSPVSIHKDFREPRDGDILVASDFEGNIVSECFIQRINRCINGTTIILSNPITLKKDILLSFYDPKLYNSVDCIHSTIVPGVYMKFTENENGIVHKKYGKYQEIIKNKNIVSFNLKLISKKTYTAK